MTLEVIVVAAFRIVGSLPVLRWPLAGGLLALAVDLADLLLIDLLDLGGVGGIEGYQALDKWLDQVYLACFLIVALRWRDPARAIAVTLYLIRLAGFVAFELSGERAVLLAFPNVFELWFLLVAWRGDEQVATWRRGRLAAVLAGLLVVKLVQEWALHGARLFDGIGALEALELMWRTVTGG